MAKLKSRHYADESCQPEFFSRGLVLASRNVYKTIFQKVAELYGKKLRHITPQLIKRVIAQNELWSNEIILTTSGKVIDLEIVLENIELGRDRNFCEVAARVLFPIRGKNGNLEAFMNELLLEAGIWEGGISSNSWKIFITIEDTFVRIFSKGSKIINHDSLPIFITKEEYEKWFIESFFVSN